MTTASKAVGCIFCDALSLGDDIRARILFRGARNFVILNIFPYNNGHLMIVPFEHLASPVDSDGEQTAEMMDLLKTCQRALISSYHPDGFNIGMNLGRFAGAGVLDHYHLHVVPRWNGDTNYISVLSETRVLAEDLDQTYRRLQPLFQARADRCASGDRRCQDELRTD